jgi:hypothetical protein
MDLVEATGRLRRAIREVTLNDLAAPLAVALGDADESSLALRAQPATNTPSTTLPEASS